MQNLTCDVLVIGGGATGVCAAYDLARRGLTVILADMNDLTTGTSGRFHGLLHSGGRYAVNDPESARECITENGVLRRIVPHIVEDTGGLFVAAANDPADYAAQWVAACAVAGIETAEISVAEARQQEPALRPDIQRVFRVPDGAVDGFDLGHAFSKAAQYYGAKVLVYRKVTALHRHGDITQITLVDTRTAITQTVEAGWVLNATGPWAGQVAALAGQDLQVRWSRGVMIAMNTRWTQTIINRLRPPDDGDILVPVGTVSIIGTTSIRVDAPDDNEITPAEVSQVLDEGAAIISGFREARALRAWAGVRPLYEPPGQHEGASGRSITRTFDVVRQGAGFTSVVGGKLTTARLMAEKAADDVCAGLGVAVACTTADEELPGETQRRYHRVSQRLKQLESGKLTGPLICECEMVSRAQVEAAIATYDAPPTLDDLRRDLRIGMGPCQGGFCAVRVAGILHYARDLTSSAALDALQAFIRERFKGGRPLLWGHHLRQFLLDEMMYRRILGLDLLAGPGQGGSARQPGVTMLPAWATLQLPSEPVHSNKKIVIIGAGLAGLLAAVHATQTGAKVEVLAAGLGQLMLTPGSFQLGMFADHPGVTAFLAWDQFTAGAGETYISGLSGAALQLPSMLGIMEAVDMAPMGLADGDCDADDMTIVVGFAGWRDFDSALFAGYLEERGYSCRSIHVDLPGRHDDWDYSPTELAHRFDDPAFRAEVVRLIKGRLRDETRIGLPAVLGLRDRQVRAKMAEALGIPVFEVPTLTPSVPGTRLYNRIKHWLLRQGVRFQVGFPVTGAVTTAGRVTGVTVASAGRPMTVRGDAFILATGGLYGGGLLSDERGRVWEPIFDLPVQSHADRATWFEADLLNASGHAVHQFGITVDEALHPLAADGSVIYDNLYAAGHLLGGLTPLLGGYDEGLDLASAYAAVRAALGN